MISTNLFINLQKEDLKKRLWLIAVGFLALLLIRPVFLLMSLDNMRVYQVPTYKDMIDYLMNFFSAANIEEMVVVAVFAFFLGTSGYIYLFSKKKTDFYHALPVRREKLFMVFYIDGLLIYLGLYIISQVICMIIVTAQGFMTSEIMMQILNTFCVQSIYFLFFYHTVILAVMLTGNLLVALAGSSVLILYIPVLAQIMEGYYSQNFRSYYTASYNTFPCAKIAGISAMASYMRYCNLIDNKQLKNEKEMFLLLLTALGMSALLLALSIWLYKKRPSESAEKAMAFKKTEVVIRIFMVIPTAMLGGMLFYSFGNEDSKVWFWFGLIFTGILMHCVTEAIYNFDFKAICRHKLQLVLCLAAASAVTLCFNLDIFGYDSYIPPESKVKSAAVGFSNIDGDMNGSYIDIINGEMVNDNSMTSEGYQLRHMKLSDIKTVQSLAKAGIEEADNSNEMNWSYNNNNYVTYTIKYNMKYGKEIYRTYSCPIDKVLPQIESIYNSKEYKAGAYPLTEILKSNIEVKKIAIYNASDNKVTTMNSDSATHLLKIYLEELSELTISDIQEESPILRIAPEVVTEEYTSELYGYYIYPSFERTLAELEKLGMKKSEAVVEKIEPQDVKEIIASGTKEEDYREEDYKEITYNNDGTEDSFKKIEKLCSQFYPSSFAWNNSVLKPYEQNITFEVILKDTKGAESSIYMVVGKGQMPRFVYEDFDNKRGCK